MNSVAIVGAGITGLTAAYELKSKGIPVTVYESSARVGGVIQSVRRDGFLAEHGPNTILETSPVITALLRDLGLDSKRIYSDPGAKKRYILRHGLPMEVPGSVIEFLRSELFSFRAKCRLPFEMLVRKASSDVEESVSEFVLRRLGREFLDYAINPMIGGIYAGDPDRLSVTHAFPRLHEVEQRYGSLLLGQLLGARERRKRQETSKQSAPKFSFPDGLQTLTDRLHQKLQEDVRLRSSVRNIRRRHGAWEVSLAGSSGAGKPHSAVLLAAPGGRLANIQLEPQKPNSSTLLAFLGEIRYAPVASLVLGFRREDVSHPLDGFGVLIPEMEKRSFLGVIFSSSLFPNRAPDGHVTVTCYLGGTRSPELAGCEKATALALVLKELRSILGVKGLPVFVEHVIWPKAIPQYEVGFGRFKKAMDSVEAVHPGLHLAGHFRNGISLGDSILAGHDVAQRIRDFVTSGPAENLETAGSMTNFPPELQETT